MTERPDRMPKTCRRCSVKLTLWRRMFGICVDCRDNGWRIDFQEDLRRRREERAAKRYEVRYGTFSTSVDRREWVVCKSAVITEETLKIVYPDGVVEWVPLHYIRGPIQYRDRQAEAS